MTASQRWRPWRSYAVLRLWNSLTVKTDASAEATP